MHNRNLRIDDSLLVVVDVQEAFRKAIPAFADTVSRVSLALQGFQILGRPVIVTEQYPKGLGRTVEELLLNVADDTDVIEKSTFSAYREPAFVVALKKYEARQIVLCGIEAHVCVDQTAHDLLEAGYIVHLLTDCVASRYEHDRLAGIAKICASGGVHSSMEMALFEMMGDSRHERFRDIQAIIR